MRREKALNAPQSNIKDADRLEAIRAPAIILKDWRDYIAQLLASGERIEQQFPVGSSARTMRKVQSSAVGRAPAIQPFAS